MGILHEGHSKRKINKDPNNTKWTRDTNTFGQKILRAQGWQPGQFLGAKDAPHSELHTSANASYIRVVLKDDMKGLGFNKAKEDEVTGLDVFQDLLSRLNGKSETAVEEDRQARLAIKTHHYVEQRYGPMRFVRGGLLVGDEIKEGEKSSEERPSETEAKEEGEDVEMEKVESISKKDKKNKKSKKRKASDADDTSDQESESKSKKRRKEERTLKAAEDNTEDARAKKKKEKQDKSRSKRSAESSEDEATIEKESSKRRKSKSKDKSKSPEESEDEQVKESKKSKKSKKDKKDKKDKKKRRKEETETSNSATLDSTPAESTVSTGTSTPTLAASGTSTPRGSRNFVRARFIAQKKQAVLDTKALAQIFMVKA